MNHSVITVNDLTFSYSDKKVTNSVTLDIKDGEIFTLIGPNGCGKSTLLRLISGLIDLPYNKDRIIVNGKSLTKYNRKELARTISMLPQSRNIPNISVERLVEHGRFPYLDLTRKLRMNDKKIIENALHSMNLYNLRDKELSMLSGGERQRAYLALNLAQDTPLVFLDEPTTYLDISMQYELMETIQTLNHLDNKTIVMVLHDLNLALKYSDRLAVMDSGKICFMGTPEEFTKSTVASQIFGVKCTPIVIEGQTEYVICPVNKKDLIPV